MGRDEEVKVARVFPTRTSMTPTDRDAYVGLPDLFTPKYDEVHISCAFTWDIPKVKQLIKEWCRYGQVFEGGPAFGDQGGYFNQVCILKRALP